MAVEIAPEPVADPRSRRGRWWCGAAARSRRSSSTPEAPQRPVAGPDHPASARALGAGRGCRRPRDRRRGRRIGLLLGPRPRGDARHRRGGMPGAVRGRLRTDEGPPPTAATGGRPGPGTCERRRLPSRCRLRLRRRLAGGGLRGSGAGARARRHDRHGRGGPADRPSARHADAHERGADLRRDRALLGARERGRPGGRSRGGVSSRWPRPPRPGAPGTAAVAKRALYDNLDLSLDEAYAHASEVTWRTVPGADAQEGISAFLDKRRPAWRRDEARRLAGAQEAPVERPDLAAGGHPQLVPQAEAQAPRTLRAPPRDRRGRPAPPCGA